MEIKSSEFFRNIKKLPPPDTDEFKQLVDWEIDKIKGGVTVNGVFFSGWLYWHINHWWIRVDDIDEWGNDIRKPCLPDLRDNEWIRAEVLEKCKIEKKGYIEVGGRQGGKSEMEASYFGMNAIMYSNTQNLMVCGNDNDLSLLKDKVDFGLKNLWEGINIPRLDKTWKLNQIKLGYKKPNGDDEIWSYIIIRNANDGQNTEAAAGTTIKTFITDEIGKFPFAATFKAAEPAIRGKNGWRTVPILVGTGGSFEKGKDAENFFYNPEANNFLAFDYKDKKIKSGMFLSGLYRQDCKEEMLLSAWLRKEKGIELKEDGELSKFTILASNKEKAEQVIKKELADAKHNPDKALYLKQKMYYPIEVEDCFLRNTFNLFNTESARSQKQRLEQESRSGTPVTLFHNGEKITHKFSNKQPISNYPIRSTDDKDAPIVIYEFPIDNPPYGLYTAGCLLPGEKVMTDKRMVSVEDVKLTDKLINKDGQKVDIINLQRYLKENEDVYTLKMSNSYRKTSFTKEHPIYISDAYGNNAEPIIENRFKFEFTEVKNVKIGQWVKVPNTYIYKNEFDINILWDSSDYRIDRIFESPLYDSDFWWFIGLFLGDGWCEANDYKITLVFNNKEELHIDRFTKLVNRLFNRNVSKRVRGNSCELSFSCQELSRFIILYFGKKAFGKYIPDWAKRIPEHLKYQLLLGYLDSDGCIVHDKKRNYYSIDFVSINLELIEDIQDIFFSLGYVTGSYLLREAGERIITNKVSTTKKTYQLRIGHNDTIRFRNHFQNICSHKLLKINLDNLPTTVKSPKKGCFISVCGKYIYFKVKDIQRSLYTGWVYNFECDTNTYMCKNITTHNCDPYRQGQAAYSDSLGAVYIYKRMHDIFGEKYQDMFVASYCARPEKKETWDEQARLLIKFYNARTLCENDDISFIEYMKAKGDAHYLEKQPDWLREIVPNTTVNREYGIHRSAQKIIDYLHNCLKKYTEEIILTEKDEQGSVTREVTGIVRILDAMLLEEMIQHDEDGNFDRIVAAELAIAQALKMNPLIGKITQGGDVRIKSLYKGRETRILFPNSRGMFTKRQRKIFT